MDDELSRLAALLDSAGVEYALIGGHAVNAWLEPRFTADVDLTVEAGSVETERLSRVLQEAGFEARFTEGADLPSGPDFIRFESTERAVVLELQAAKTEFQVSLLRRAVGEPGGLRVATPEDLIVLKLIANRPKDRIDLLGLCGLPNLDWSYVEGWAQRWEAGDLLSELRRAAGSDAGRDDTPK